MKKPAYFPNRPFLPTYTEKTIPGAGWYWFIPTGGIKHLQPGFVKIEEDSLQGDLHCKRYQGEYSGPINPPMEIEAAPRIRINGHTLSPEAGQLVWEACIAFRSHLEREGLGDDEHGRKMSELYIRRITESETLLTGAPGTTKRIENYEPAICFNGHALSSAQTMAVRVGLSGDGNLRENPAWQEIYEALQEVEKPLTHGRKHHADGQTADRGQELNPQTTP